MLCRMEVWCGDLYLNALVWFSFFCFEALEDGGHIVVPLAAELVLEAVFALFLEAEAALALLPILPHFKERPTRRHVDVPKTGVIIRGRGGH